MSHHYSDPSRESDPNALPDIEVFYMTHAEAEEALQLDDMDTNDDDELTGWYWWACFPGCLPDSEPCGPFSTEAKALANAQDPCVSFAPAPIA